MVEKDHPHLSIMKQCRLLSLSRSSFYYELKGETALNLALMRQIDEQFLETPCLRCAPDDLTFAGRGTPGQREAHPAADAAHGVDADLSAPEHQPEGKRPQDLAVLAERVGDHAAKPGLVRRRDVYSDAPGLSLPRRDHGLGDKESSGPGSSPGRLWRLSNSEPCRAIGPSDNGERRPASVSKP